jgi:hypothetical protein
LQQQLAVAQQQQQQQPQQQQVPAPHPAAACVPAQVGGGRHRASRCSHTRQRTAAVRLAPVPAAQPPCAS